MIPLIIILLVIVAVLAFPFIALGALIFGHFNIFESSAVKAVEKAKVPILLIHGDDDRFVPFEMSCEIYRKRPDLIQFYPFPDAGHGISYLVDTERYEKLVREFLDRILKKAGKENDI